MRHGAWARRAGSFATRLVLAVLVTACLTAAAQSVLAGRLAVRSVERDAVGHALTLADAARERVGERSVDGAQDLAHDRALLDAALTELTAAGTARVVDPPQDGEATVVHRAVGDRDVLVVTAPVVLRSGTAGVEIALDGTEAQARSAALRRSLLVVIGLGAVAAVPLVLLLGGRRLLRRHQDVVELAGTDELTGAGNRRSFDADLDDAVAEARRCGTPLSVVLAEVVGLSAVTTTVGRRRADRVLADVGTMLLERHPGHAYRIGGDVFAVVMPGTPPEEAFALADLLRAEVAEALPPLSLTAGVAGLDGRCPDGETLVIAADAALDEARALGGNRVVGPGEGAFGLRWVANRPHD